MWTMESMATSGLAWTKLERKIWEVKKREAAASRSGQSQTACKRELAELTADARLHLVFPTWKMSPEAREVAR